MQYFFLLYLPYIKQFDFVEKLEQNKRGNIQKIDFWLTEVSNILQKMGNYYIQLSY